AEYGVALWEAIASAGKDAGIRPFGVEAQRTLRLEKGHIIVGQDTDGLTTPDHADMGWAIAHGKPFFIGQRAIRAIAARGLDRRLVGFRAGAEQPVPDECNLVIQDGAIAGRVTSVVESASCGATVGLAYVPPGRAETGTPVQIRTTSGAICHAEVVETPFYDPGNARQEL
ncbi:MAG: aminomethyltransferase, partial [Gammaproteobacteria bacterium]|nr:aminomethyltransferase [Gammaproteobacteria bacterium]